MSQIARLQGAEPQETFWFSRWCHAVSGQFSHVYEDDKTAAICSVNSLSSGDFLAYFCSFDTISTLCMSR